jgi:two-component system NtrC family sensor kinase
MPDDTKIDPGQTVAALRQELAALAAERDEALAERAAMAEVLQVINSSSGDLGLVFETLLGTGARLCKAEQAVITLRNLQDGLYHYGASFGYGRDFKDLLIRNPVAPGRASLIGRTALEGRVVHIEDAAADPEYKWAEALRLGRWHTGLGVPLLRDGAVTGTFALTRRRIERFTDKQIELIKTFADQAVIAIENTRLLGELRESEERYGLVSKAVAEGIYEWDVEHNSLWVSSRLIEIFGFRGRNLTAADWNDLVHPQDFPKYSTALRDCFKSVRARLDCEYRVRHSDGQYRWIEDRGVPVRNASGRAVRLVGAVSDVSARKEADEALREALEQQTATAEVLQVINSSPGDLAPVFDAMLEKAMRLCEAEFGLLTSYDGEAFHAAALRGVPASFAESWREPRRPGPGLALHRLARGENLVHIPDVTAENAYQSGDPIRRALADLGGARTGLWVALRKDSSLLGAFVIYRKEVRLFSDEQISLLQNFAAQAVIAMENARLLTETREALEQQTATAEILQVINSSPGDLAPVFDAILEKAHSLCGVAHGGLVLREGETFRAVALHSYSGEFAEQLRQGYRGADNPITRSLMDGDRFLHIPDLAQIDHPMVRASVENAGVRTGLYVPLRKDGALLGMISSCRREIRPFSDKQIALLQNFAAQAVIAMENARLITETREALEQQTATAEVLQVINSSPGDLTPVFDAMLEKAMALCEGSCATLYTLDQERARTVAIRGASGVPEWMRHQDAFDPPPGSSIDRLRRGTRFVHLLDARETEAYHASPLYREMIDISGCRSSIAVALRREGTVVGVIAIYRQEVRPFSEKQIALLQNFAAQAVIAMENARLFTETREALEQQTATAEVLRVINSSPGDLTPVFDAMLDKALRLCGAAFGALFTYDGECFPCVATRDFPPALLEYYREPVRKLPGSAMGRLVRGQSTSQVTDIRADALRSPLRRALADLGGARTMIWVALRKERSLLGCIAIYRQEVRPFSEKEVALLESFAAQAVIAMENARLLGELRERTHDLEESLEFQTATSDVLQVISRSTFDLQPVLETLTETAARLCEADTANIMRLDGDVYRAATALGYSPEYKAFVESNPFAPGRGSITGRVALEHRPVHVLDVENDPEYTWTEGQKIGKFRTMLGVPLLREDALLGVIFLARTRVEPFTERQIELVRTFADQAVIAIENARLITETREALEQQTATAEILQVINRSPGDLTPVFEAILDKAHTLCSATLGSLFLFDGELSRAAATHGYPDDVAQRLRQGVILSSVPQLLEGARWLHNPDLRLVDNPTARAVSGRGGVRTNLMLPLRKDGRLLGTISCNRQEVRPFSEKEIALLESFAAQAVIAMDNARLLDEIRRRQAELRVTFDNMGDGVAMFDSELRLAAWNLNFQRILELPDALLAERPRVEEFVRYLATHGEYGAVDVEAEVRRLSERAGTQWSAERTRPDGRVIEVRSNPVPGGGVVLIYSDVTERKRAEAEIRAARDTAERALQELQTTQASLLHAQKMAALGQLTAGIAHEIKNPLNFVNNFAELSGELLLELKETTAPAVAALGDDERAAVDEVVEMLRGNLDKIAEHGKRADGIVKSMLEHSRGVSGERRVVDLNALIEEALNLAYHGARAQDASFNITLEREFDRGLAPMELAPQEMTRVFLNLFGNGFYATAKRQRDGAGAGFRPTLKVATRELGDAVEVRVRDNGTGIASEIRDKLFQPFVTTKPTGEGTGLGLSISYDIVTQQHGGTIEVDSRLGEFTEFTIRLPRAR